jgi:hypothetical protein
MVGAIPVAAASPTPDLTRPQLFGVHPLLQGQTTLPGGHFSFALVAGQTATDGVVVENFADQPLDFHIYGADLLTAVGGGLAPAQATDAMHEAGAWIVVATPRVTIPAHSRITSMFTISLPSAISPGEHLGALVAAALVGTSSQGSTIEARTALITNITVPGAISPSGRLGPLSRTPGMSRDVGFAIILSNTGNLLLTYVGSVDVLDRGGHTVASLSLAPASAYVVPGGHVGLDAVWPGLPSSGTYSARATVTILAKGRPVATLTSQSLPLSFASPAPIPPAVATALGGFVLAAGIVIAVRRRRRRPGRRVAVKQLSHNSDWISRDSCMLPAMTRSTTVRLSRSLFSDHAGCSSAICIA